MDRKRGKITDAVEILHRRFVDGDPEMESLLESAYGNAKVGEQIYKLREEVGLTQRELAERVQTTASVISRLEDADYDKPSLTMLRRIAAALNHRVEVVFVPLDEATPMADAPPQERKTVSRRVARRSERVKGRVPTKEEAFPSAGGEADSPADQPTGRSRRKAGIPTKAK
jgi:transcriptional regulator with XRE-family HTH domain